MIYVDNPRIRKIMEFIRDGREVTQAQVRAHFNWQTDGMNNYFSALQRYQLITFVRREKGDGLRVSHIIYRATGRTIERALAQFPRALVKRGRKRRRQDAPAVSREGSIALAGRRYCPPFTPRKQPDDLRGR